MTSPTLVVAGALANKPGNGGEAWVRMSWVRGLARLGFDVWFVEEIVDDRPDAPPLSPESMWFGEVVAAFGIAERAVLVRSASGGTYAVDQRVSADVDVGQLLRDCSLLVNISGNLRHRDLIGLPARAAYVDLDPGFTQIWAANAVGDLGLDRHQLHFTVGELIGTSACALPTAGFHWRPCRQPVVLDDWPADRLPDGGRFTTVATWRCGFGAPVWNGTEYGLKVHEFRKIIDLPQRTSAPLELALDIHADDDVDRCLLRDRGWHVREAFSVAATPDAFRAYVQASVGELSVAQGVYAAGHSGWFSDRTVRYLASGRPAIVQDTGWADGRDVDAGLLTFRDLAGAHRALDEVWGDLERHAKAARNVAEEHFASDAVLSDFLALADVDG